MGLLWFILLVGITGLAVDTINGFRNRTMLQAAADADAAALGGAIDLPAAASAVTSAVALSSCNRSPAVVSSLRSPSASYLAIQSRITLRETSWRFDSP